MYTHKPTQAYVQSSVLKNNSGLLQSGSYFVLPLPQQNGREKEESDDQTACKQASSLSRLSKPQAHLKLW